MLKVNFNICFWTFHDVDNRIRNTNFSWKCLKRFIDYAKNIPDLEIKCFLYDLSPKKRIEEAIHIPVEKVCYERSKKINLCIEHNYLYSKPDLICFLDSDVFFEENQYDKFINILRNFDKKTFYTSRVLDIQNNLEVDFENLKIDENVNFQIREIPGLGAFFLVDFESIFNIGGFDERFLVWGGEDDDLRVRLLNSGLNRKNIPIALFHLNHDNGLIHHANVENSEQKQKQLDICWHDKSIIRNTTLSKYRFKNLEKKNAIDLLTSFRFDINAKLIYAKSILKNLNYSFAKEIYLKHLEVWNNFFEDNPRKETSQDFIKSFDQLFNSIKNYGFIEEQKNYIPIKNNSPYNGAHRVASCIVLKKEVYCLEEDKNGQYNCNFEYFQNKGLNDFYCDELALEFVRNKKNTYTISIFDSENKNLEFVENLLKQNLEIIYKKDINFTELGKHNYIITIYRDEKWIGNNINYFEGALGKTNMCFRNSNKIRLYIVETSDSKVLVELKKNIREYFKQENHSVHINDTYQETWKICSTLLNKNSLNFLQKEKIPFLQNFNNLMIEYKKFLEDKDQENFCLTSSATMSLFSLRDCADFDYLTIPFNENYYNFKSNKISSHLSELKYYVINFEDIIFDPKNYLYYEGIKFASLKIIFDMKNIRNESKDKVDCELIKTKL